MLRGRTKRRAQNAATTKKHTYHVEQDDPRALEIQAVLEEDLANGAKLMQSEYREYALKEKTLDGQSAAAAAAYFHLDPSPDPRAAGMRPMQATRPDGSRHWWISRRQGREEVIIDLTLRHTEEPDYDYGSRSTHAQLHEPRIQEATAQARSGDHQARQGTA